MSGCPQVEQDTVGVGQHGSDIYLWAGNLGKTVMRGLEDGDGDVNRYRSILRRIVAPAFVSSNAAGSA